MILFYEIAKVVVTLVENVLTKGLANGTWIRAMPIRRDLLRRMARRLEGLLEKPLRCVYISFLTQHRVNQIPILINSAIEVAPFPLHFDIGFINMPEGPHVPTSPRS